LELAVTRKRRYQDFQGRCCMNKLAMTVIALAALLTPALASEQTPVAPVPVDWAVTQASVQRGKELFNSTKLGTKPISCASCHPNGSRLQRAASYNEKRLVKIINQCISSMLAGKPLPVDSDDMAAFVSYLRTFEPIR
jgi:cytochrome c peroxidase